MKQHIGYHLYEDHWATLCGYQPVMGKKLVPVVMPGGVDYPDTCLRCSRASAGKGNFRWLRTVKKGAR